MVIRSLLFALGFGIVGYYYAEHSVLEAKKAVSQWRDSPQSDEPKH